MTGSRYPEHDATPAEQDPAEKVPTEMSSVEHFLSDYALVEPTTLGPPARRARLPWGAA
jgi:hypothetical protein